MGKKFVFISRLLESNDPIIIMPFGGYVGHESIHAQARVLEDEGIQHTEEDSVMRNLINSFKRFETDEISNAKVIAQFQDAYFEYNSDKEGYIYVDEKVSILPNLGPKTKWLPLDFRLIIEGDVVHEVTSNLMQPCATAEYGVISDLDETVLHTGLTSKFKYQVILNTIFKHSRKRTPLKGVKEFYKLLHKGKTGNTENPFFYLSNSPWNLYEYLTDFLNYQKLPKGTLLLRDIGFENKKKKHFKDRNKFVKISHILNTYPNLNFVLIGDAVDIDHEIYIEVAKQFENRILAIYIRTVEDQVKMNLVKALIEKNTHIKVTLIQSSEEAIKHAKDLQLIPS